MYQKHFGLLRRPFELAPDAGTFFLGEMHTYALAGLRQTVADNTPFQLLTGPAGSGKTAVLQALVASLEFPGYLCMIAYPAQEVADFFSYLGTQFGLLFGGNRAKFLVLFANLLEECRESGRKILLIIDEAHSLPVSLLEELRILANLAAEVKSVFGILLAGQPELLGRLTREQLFLLNQRMTVRFHLTGLSRDDCRQYIIYRLNRAGAEDGGIFSERAGELIYEATGGNPRQINMLCDNALLAAYSRGITLIDEELVRDCVERLHVSGDNGVFSLPSEKSGIRKWLAWMMLGTLLVEGAGVAYAYQKGWLVPVYQYLMKSIKLG